MDSMELSNNFTRMDLAKMKILTNILRFILQNYLPASEIQTMLNNLSRKAERKLKLSEKEWKLLEDVAKNESYESIDVSLMCKLFPYIQERGKKTNQSIKRDTENNEIFENIVKRIKHLRNYLAHVPKHEISNEDFDKKWKELQSICLKLDGIMAGDFSKSLQMYHDCIVDIDVDACLSDAASVDTFRHSEMFSEELAKREVIIEEWIKERKRFYPTRACKEVERRLRLTSLLTIAGNPGCGKSSIAQYISVSYISKNWNVIPVDSIRDIITLSERCPQHEQLFFVLDDPLGKDHIDEYLLNDWKKFEKTLESYLKSYGKIILLSCRTNILNDKRVPHLLKAHKITIDDPKWKLKTSEKKHILDLFLRFSNDRDCELTMKEKEQFLHYRCFEEITIPHHAKIEIFKYDRYFLRLCNLFVKRSKYRLMGSKFFEKHHLILRDEISDLKENDKLKFCALLLLFAKGGIVNSESLRKNEMSFEATFDSCGLPRNSTLASIMDELKNLDGLFVKKIGEEYMFRDENVMHATASIFGSTDQKDLIRICPFDFLIQHVDIIDTFCIIKTKIAYVHESITDELLDVLCDRYFQEIKMNYVEVCLCSILRNVRLKDVILKRISYMSKEELEGIFLNTIKKDTIPKLLDDDLLSFLFNNEDIEDRLNNSKNTSNELRIKIALITYASKISPLSCVLMLGDTNIFIAIIRRLLDMNVEKQLLREHNLFFAACVNGSLSVSKEILKVLGENEINQKFHSLGSEFSSLHVSTLLHNYDVIRYLLKYKPIDINITISNGYTPLHLFLYSIARDFPKQHFTIMMKIVNILREHTRNNNQHVEMGFSFLYIACKSNFTELVKLFCNKFNINSKTLHGDTPLLHAVMRGNDSVVDFLLKNGAIVNNTNSEGYTPLHLAANLGFQSIVEMLLKNKADVSIPCKEGETPIIIAAKNGHFHVVKCIIKNRSGVNDRDKNGNTILSLAVACEKLDIVEQLLQNNANVNLANVEGNGPLNVAALKGFLSILKVLLHYGADVNQCNKYHESPLMSASLHGHSDVVRVLLNNEANVNHLDLKQQSSLWHACRNGHTTVTTILVQHNAEENLCDLFNCSPLFIAAKLGYIGPLQALLSSTCSPNQRDYMGKTVLMTACENGRSEVVSLLLKYGSNLNIFDDNCHSPLWYASKGGFNNLVKVLIKEGADVHSNNRYHSPIYVAAEEGHIDVVTSLLSDETIESCDKKCRSLLSVASGKGHWVLAKYLIDEGAKINAKDYLGRTPLFYAVKNGKINLVRLLMDSGADEKICDFEGNTPIHMASKKGSTNMLQILLDGNCIFSINAQNIRGETALYLSCEQNKIESAVYLISKNADISVSNKYGLSPLHISVCNRHNILVSLLSPMIRLLMKINMKDISGQTALIKAVCMGYSDTVQILLSQDSNVNEKDAKGRSALWYAAEKGFKDIIIKLLNEYPLINLQDKMGLSPLHVASEKNNQKVLFELLACHANINLHDKDGNTPFLIAAKAGSEGVLNLYLTKFKSNLNINVCNREKQTALMFLAMQGKLDLADSLIKLGVNINAQNASGQTALSLAVLNGHLQMIKLLVQNNADLKLMNFKNRDLLFLSAEQGNLEVLKFLIFTFKNVFCDRYRLMKALNISAEKGHYQICKTLLQFGAPLETCSENEKSPWLTAAEYGHHEIISLFQDWGSNVNFKNKKSQSALILATASANASNETFYIVQDLIQAGADVNAFDNKGRSALWYASANGLLNTVRLLVQYANIHQSDKQNVSPLHAAVRHNNINVVNLLIEKCACRHFASNFNLAGESSLLVSVFRGSFGMVEMLIISGCNVNQCNKENVSALMIAAAEGHLSIVQLLLRNRANPNIQDARGRSALFYSSGNNFKEIVEELLQNNADVNVHDKSGKTALYIATLRGHESVVNVLLNHGATIVFPRAIEDSLLWVSVLMGHLGMVKIMKNRFKLYYSNKSLNELLLIAAFCGHNKLICYLLECGFSVNCRNLGLETPLHLAVNKGYFFTAKILVERGANVNAKDIGGRSPIWYAAKKGNLDIMRLLLRNFAAQFPDINGISPLQISGISESVSRMLIGYTNFRIESKR